MAPWIQVYAIACILTVISQYTFKPWLAKNTSRLYIDFKPLSPDKTQKPNQPYSENGEKSPQQTVQIREKGGNSSK